MAACLSNLRQIGQASAMYSSQYKGYVVPEYASATAGRRREHKADSENYATVLVNAKLLQAPDLRTWGQRFEHQERVRVPSAP